jgi:O86/O127-antigen biosynthesis alpha-1,3-N-acetylgalactosaminyltransferase
MKPFLTFIITKNEVGGAQKFIINLANGLAEYYEKILVITITNGTSFIQESLTKINIEVLPINKIKIHHIHEIKNSIIIGNSALGGVLSRFAGLILLNKNTFYVSHGWSSVYNSKSNIYNLVERGLSLLTKKIFCVSKADYITAINKIKINKRKLIHISNVVPPLNCKENHKISNKVISVMRNAYPKRIDLLVELCKLKSEFIFHLYGVDHNEINQIDIPKNLKLQGIQKNIPYCDYDLFVLLSDSEGLPLSAIEAKSVNLPLLLSAVGGCREIISDNGILTDNTIDHISDNFDLIFKNYSNYRNLETKKKTRIEWDNYLNLYQKHLNDN